MEVYFTLSRHRACGAGWTQAHIRERSRAHFQKEPLFLPASLSFPHVRLRPSNVPGLTFRKKGLINQGRRAPTPFPCCGTPVQGSSL